MRNGRPKGARTSSMNSCLVGYSLEAAQRPFDPPDHLGREHVVDRPRPFLPGLECRPDRLSVRFGLAFGCRGHDCSLLGRTRVAGTSPKLAAWKCARASFKSWKRRRTLRAAALSGGWVRNRLARIPSRVAVLRIARARLGSSP